MNYPNPPQQPGPYGGQQPPRQQPPPYGQQPYGQQPPPFRPPSTPPHGQQPPQYGQQPPPPPYGQPSTPPHGQQSPPSPPYGQPQQPPPSDYPPAPSSAAPAKPSGKKRLISGLVALVVVAAGIGAYFIFGRDSASSAEAGDCIKVNSASATSADVEKIDCNDQIAVFKVAKKLDNDTDQCPTNDYEKYTQSGGRGSDFALCLMLNAKEGECLADFDTPDKRARVACGANAQVKVAKLVNGSADDGACEPDSVPLVYPEPATTFCLIPQP